MRTEFLRKFSKDIDKIDAQQIRAAILEAIQNVEQAENLTEIRNIKKLSGFADAYRIRIGDYRIGLFVDGDVVQFARVVHRKDIYKFFP